MNLDPLAKSLAASLDAKNHAREQALPLCRKAIRFSANAIRAVHRGDREECERLIGEAQRSLNEASAAVVDHPDVKYAGFFHDAAKEFAEAEITSALVFGEPIPAPEDLSVEPPAYLNGLGEAIGEMRRHVLDLMRRGELERSEELLGSMDEIYYLLTSMDYPDAMTGGLRRTTDVARGIIERTRGDLTTTMIQEGLKSALEQASGDSA